MERRRSPAEIFSPLLYRFLLFLVPAGFGVAFLALAHGSASELAKLEVERVVGEALVVDARSRTSSRGGGETRRRHFLAYRFRTEDGETLEMESEVSGPLYYAVRVRLNRGETVVLPIHYARSQPRRREIEPGKLAREARRFRVLAAVFGALALLALVPVARCIAKMKIRLAPSQPDPA